MLIRVDSTLLDRALQDWNAQYADVDEGLAIDAKTMCNAIDEEGPQTHILNAVDHQTRTCHMEPGRLDSRAIRTTTQLNDYLNFPFVGQTFAIERLRIEKKAGVTSTDVVYGLTDHTPQSADPARLLAFNRDHRRVEAHHYILDWNRDEDRCTIRTGHGSEGITRLRRFATALIQSKSTDRVAATIAKLARNVRRVFDYLRMTESSNP